MAPFFLFEPHHVLILVRSYNHGYAAKLHQARFNTTDILNRTYLAHNKALYYVHAIKYHYEKKSAFARY